MRVDAAAPVDACNATASKYPANLCVHELFEQQAGQTPDRLALAAGDERLTYGQLNARANRIAHYLRGRGVGPDGLVGICVERSADMVAAVLGVLKAGGAYVPLDPSYPGERIQYIVEDARARILLSSEKVRGVLPEMAAEVVTLEGSRDAIARENDSNPACVGNSRNLAYVIYTSGSTGKPKGVEIEHRSVVNFLTSMQKKPGLTADDVLLAVTTLSFDIAGLELYLPLVSGGQVIVASRTDTTDGRRLMEFMEQRGVSVMQATPATWRLLLDSGWKGNGRLKVLCGGEALPRDLAEQLLPRCGELWNMYGPTETTIWSTVYHVREVNWTTAPIGRPIANTQAYVLNANREPVAQGGEGELWLGGDGVARGYYRRPDLTAERFLADPFSAHAEARIYRTGDLVRSRVDGDIEYLGRIDNQVKIRGFRIELGEIESRLGQHPAVKSAVVVAREDTPGDKRLAAYLVRASAQEVSGPELRAFLKKFLPDYMLPSTFVKLEHFPLTPNGKIDRRALPVPQSSDFDSPGEYIAPRSKVEQTLVAICEEVLRIRPIGVTTNL
ncbi:MAG TPA: amino acid adenylation domain-containing protein, partial [Terriglobales bacterium]